MDRLKEWSCCNSFNTIYDSRKDDYSNESVQHVLYGKHNIFVLIETPENDIFGVFHKTVTTQKRAEGFSPMNGWVWDYDPEMYIFVLKNHTAPEAEPKRFERIGFSEASLGIYLQENHFEMVYFISDVLSLLDPLYKNKSFIANGISKQFKMEGDELIGRHGLSGGFSISRMLIVEGI
ncbi:hypothetical protein EIN_397360 [Entamoeba invadens IP1]|uniref:TLDc domain-containing protein n=1 Tax=Entamoeba invadens IP1 TaxID=370355 RepID=A0A0A1UDG5_ENTIV|nr:hypothetical protein EIN_397360 [Entamoeba invadens IP1]ELP91856.1 hypothetical protein EIN_397360 [Entamoeba invadens IP1]|eukprot:XP_004258627.1 hypothetical protein EIN_397360 [Entamoeba invadens IP1]